MTSLQNKIASDGAKESYIRSTIFNATGFGPLGTKKAEVQEDSNTEIASFKKSLSQNIAPNLPAKELVSLVVRSAMEAEFGKNFTLNSGFDKMVKKITDSIVVNPDLRRQALAVVSTIIEEKSDSGKKN